MLVWCVFYALEAVGLGALFWRVIVQPRIPLIDKIQVFLVLGAMVEKSIIALSEIPPSPRGAELGQVFGQSGQHFHLNLC